MWLFDSTDPETSRERFVSREYRNVIRIVGFFILGVSLVSFVVTRLLPSAWVPLLIVDTIGLGTAYYFYIILENRPIRLRCPNCDMVILSNTPWVCSVCKEANKNTNDFPFVHRCENEECKTVVKAYLCHHCKEVIYLSEDRDDSNCAYAFVSPEVDPHIERMKELKERKEKKNEVREIARVEEDLARIRKTLRAGKVKPKSTKEVIEADVASTMETEQVEAELEALYKEKFKGAIRTRMLKALKKAVEKRKHEGE